MDAEMVEEPVFRPSKRRRFLRKRQSGDEQDDDDGSRISPPQRAAVQVEDAPEDIDGHHLGDKNVSVAELLRLRKSHRSRKGGIEFSTTGAKVEEGSGSTTALAVQNAAEHHLDAIVDRFVPHSGQVVDVDKHMYVVPPKLSTLQPSGIRG